MLGIHQIQHYRWKMRLTIGLAISIAVLGSASLGVNASNDFGASSWILPIGVINAGCYNTWIGQIDAPNNMTNTFTTGWMSVDLDNAPGLYGAKFTQVGIKSYIDP